MMAMHNWDRHKTSNDCRTQYEEGIALAQQRDTWRDSVYKLRAAVQRDPGFGPAHYSLGQVLLLLWMVEEDETPDSDTKSEAIGELKVATELMPDDPEPFYELCHTRQPVEIVLPSYERAMKLPNGMTRPFGSAHWAFAMAASSEGQKELAVAAFRRALALDPEQCGMWQPSAEPALSYWREAKSG